MGDEGAAAQHLEQLGGDVGEARLVGEHLGGQAVHVGWPRIDTGVEQSGDAVFDVAVVADREDRDADDAGLPWAEPGRLDVDDRPARAGFGSRPAPGVAHKVRMARQSDISR